MEVYDTELAESRDKKHYREKSKRKTCIKTVYGEAEYKRIAYRTKTEQGENAYVYLLDETMQMDKIGLISTNLAEKIAMTVTESPYHVTAEIISNTYGQSISSRGVWNMMQRQPHRERHFGMRLYAKEKLSLEGRGCDKCSLPILLDSSNSVEKLCVSWVQTRGYEACVFCMPIPLRVC